MVARMTPADLSQSLDRARAAQRQLSARRLDDVLERLDAVILDWLAPDSPWMAEAQQRLPDLTGFSAPMIAHGLPRLLAPLRGAAIAAVLDAELAGGALPEGGSAAGHWLIAHVLSGNIPALGAAPLLLSLAIRRAVLLKPAAGDPLTPELLQRSVAAVDPVLGDCVVIAPWRGGDRPLEEITFAAASVVVAMGSDDALAAIAARVPGRFIGHGHKVSFAMIGRDALDGPSRARKLASALAYDATLWDQQGCLSPQLVYVESGGHVGIDQFADYLGAALAEWDVTLPPRRLSLDDRAAIAEFRQAAEWGMHGSRRLLHGGDRSPWSLSIEEDPTFLPSCLHRCLRLKPIASLEEVPPRLAGLGSWLEAAGVAVSTDRLERVTAALTQAGVHRVCPIGTMQTPGLEWRQGGRPRVAEWLGFDPPPGGG